MAVATLVFSALSKGPALKQIFLHAQMPAKPREILNLAVDAVNAGVRIGVFVFVAVVFSVAACAARRHTNSPMTAIGVVVVVTAVTVVTVAGPTFIIP